MVMVMVMVMVRVRVILGFQDSSLGMVEWKARMLPLDYAVSKLNRFPGRTNPNPNSNSDPNYFP